MTVKAKPVSTTPAVSSPSSTRPARPTGKSAETSDTQPNSIDNIARFFGAKAEPGKPHLGKPGSMPRPAFPDAEPSGAAGLKKGQRVRHAKYGEGTVLMREGDGEDAKLTVLFSRHGMKKLMEKFANLKKM
jgi:DNA helicase-2/ATP-dependent DNA helicase PcrA